MPTTAPPIIPPFAIRKEDLADPHLTVLVGQVQKMANTINYLLGASGPVQLYDNLDLQGHSVLNQGTSGANSSLSVTGNAVNQTASIPSVVQLIPDVAGLFQVSAFIHVYTYASGTLSLAASFFDDSGAAQSANLQVIASAGAAGTSMSSKDFFYTTPALIFCTAKQRINLSTTSTFSANSSYAIYASIKQVA